MDTLVSVDEVTFAGKRGQQLCAEIRGVTAGVMSIEDALPELRRGPDGMIDLKVTNATIDVIAGRAVIRNGDATSPDLIDPA